MSLTINHQTDDISNLTGATTFNGVAVGGDNTPVWYGSRAIMAGGQVTSYSASNIIDYVAVQTTGNAIDFGDLVVARSSATGVSNGTRGVITGEASNTAIDYVTIATTGNAQDFGDLSVGRGAVGSSNGTTGIFAGGWMGSRSNTIDTITIATTGNATDFGDLITARNSLASCADSTRALFAGGLD